MVRRAVGRRCIVAAVAALAVVAVSIAGTIATTETVCRGAASAGPAQTDANWRSILAASETRSEVDSYLTYPEWAIVFAYDDFAAVTRRGSESDFRYVDSIRSFWTSLCAVKRVAASHGDITFDTNAMLYIIGFSFSAEMAAKGLYEDTIGAATAWLRGATRTPEDEFALSVADDYAQFLRQTPWYAYPFFDTLGRFWTSAPYSGGNIVRKIERRIGLSVEYGFKAIYAKALGALAGISPAPLRIRSVVKDLRAEDLAMDSRISLVRRQDNLAVIETPRYQEFTDILTKLASRNLEIVEIAGNRRILVTVLTPQCASVAEEGSVILFMTPIQVRSGWCRTALDVPVPRLAALLRNLSKTTNEVEHVFDY